MPDTLSRDDLVVITRRLMTNDFETEEEANRAVVSFNESIPHPAKSDLIFYPEREFATPEELVDYALSYRPEA